MYLTIVTLQPESDEGGHPDGMVVQDVIWALATSVTGLQHVRVSAHVDEIDVALFCVAASPDEAHAAAVALCRRACDVSPVLHGWQVRPCPCI